MAIKKVITSLIGSGIQVTVGGERDVVIGPDALVHSSGNYAIYLTGSNQKLTISGTVSVTGDDAIKFGDSSTDKNHVVVIEKSGMVIGDFDDGLSFASRDPRIVNHGTVIADYAIYCSNEFNEHTQITNTGLIIGLDSTAIYVSGTSDGIAEIRNSGKIYAYGNDAIDGSNSRLNVLNSGLIEANGYAAVDGDNASDAVKNTGRIIGLVELNGGEDIYDGRGGIQIGSVYGGSGNDSIIGGKRAENLLGDGGNDFIGGGFGKDTLTGGAGDDGFLFIAPGQGSDFIADFGHSVGNDDHIILMRDGFDPALQLGGLAASRFQQRSDHLAQRASDRFIFDTSSHTLWFDKDGIGNAHAVLLATVLPSETLSVGDIFLI